MGSLRLTAAVEAGGLDGVVVKDLSRLGRHRTQTALFIDYLRERGVRVLSATERLDTFREEDDLIIGVRGLMNDYYARDIGKKIRAGYRQKQKEGIVITPPFGYWKDRNTGEIKIQPEAAETVRSIYALYLEGCGQKEIARRLNGLGRKTPAQLRAEHCGREVRATHKTQDGKYLWTYASVKNVLTEESYTGVLMNHRSETNGRKVKRLSEEAWYRHEGFLPVIIPREQWEAVQQRLKEQARPPMETRPSTATPDCWPVGSVETFRPHDPVLERQAACGVCVPGLSPEREKLLHLPPNSRRNTGHHGVGVPYGGSGQSH